MNLNWKSKKIKDIADVIGGGTPSTKIDDYWHGNIPWITPKDLSESTSKYILQGKKSITEKGLIKSGAQLIPKYSLLFSSRAPIGYLSINKCAVSTNQGFKSLVPKQGYLTEYLYYLIKSKIKYIKSYATGSTFEEISGSSVKNLEFNFPPLTEQKKISQVLSLLDNKIEINQKINQTLEDISLTLFNSWFNKFDPVIAKSKGKSTGLIKEVSDLFPETFEVSEMGKIPKGFQINEAQDIYKISIGKTPPRKEHEWFSNNSINTPWISIRDMGNNGIFALKTSEFLTKEAIEKFNIKIIPKGTVILSFKLTVGRVSILSSEMTSNEAIAHFIPRKNYLSKNFTYCLLKTFRYESLSSTSSIATAVNSKSINKMNFCLPSIKLIEYFNKITDPLFQKILLNEKEIQTLINLRDILIPKLISGKLTTLKLKEL